VEEDEQAHWSKAIEGGDWCINIDCVQKCIIYSSILFKLLMHCI
jgi:hypothetical protein